MSDKPYPTEGFRHVTARGRAAQVDSDGTDQCNFKGTQHRTLADIGTVGGPSVRVRRRNARHACRVAADVHVLAHVLDHWRCRQVGRVLQAHLDGELAAEVSADVTAHLEACRRCGMAAENFTAISSALSTMAVELDPGVRRRLEALLDDLG